MCSSEHLANSGIWWKGHRKLKQSIRFSSVILTLTILQTTLWFAAHLHFFKQLHECQLHAGMYFLLHKIDGKSAGGIVSINLSKYKLNVHMVFVVFIAVNRNRHMSSIAINTSHKRQETRKAPVQLLFFKFFLFVWPSCNYTSVSILVMFT